MGRLRAGCCLLVLVLVAPAAPALAWGPIAHQAVTGKAIDTLPGGLKDFFKRHRHELPSLSFDATFPDEGRERRFAVDRLQAFPFRELPRNEAGLAARFGEGARDVGRLPFLIQESYGRLVEAFKAGDKARILEESDLLSGLVTDIHNPLALTENADGQKTSQHGLWVRFTVKLPEAMEKRLKLDPDAAHFLDDPGAYVFDLVAASYIWLDNLLYEEELAKRGKSGYTEIYYESLELRAREILRDRLSRAAGAAGSFWYTAWTVAGRPRLR